MEDGLAPLASDLPAARTLAREAVLARYDPGVDLAELVPVVDQQLREGTARGALRVLEGRPVGLAFWSPEGAVGLVVRDLYLRPPLATPEGYRAFLEALEHSTGPVAFAPSLPGLTVEAEAATLGSMGFARYARIEMRFPSTAPMPSDPVSARDTVRPFRPSDERAVVAVHAAAYRDHFDRYLFAEDVDPDRDAELAVRELIEGRYGPFLPSASMVAERRGQIVAETIVVGPPDRALIADVAVHPDVQGAGLGRAVLSGTVRALRAQGRRAIALVVTEGNRPAVRLYSRLGFVRSLGPTREWYSTRLVPVGPERD